MLHHKIIYFDIEAFVLKERFVPNLLVSQIVCKACEKEEIWQCSECGVRNRFFDEKKTLIDDFLNYIMDVSKNSSSKTRIFVISHFSSGFDIHFLYQKLLERSDLITKAPIKMGRKILTLGLGRNVTFLDSLKFIPMSLRKMMRPSA